jgi:hypothetical protein
MRDCKPNMRDWHDAKSGEPRSKQKYECKSRTKILDKEECASKMAIVVGAEEREILVDMRWKSRQQCLSVYIWDPNGWTISMHREGVQGVRYRCGKAVTSTPR